MIPLEQLSIRQRITVAIVTVVLAVLLVIIINWLSNGEAEAQITQDGVDLYEGIPLDARLLRLDKDSLDAAYQALRCGTCSKSG